MEAAEKPKSGRLGQTARSVLYMFVVTLVCTGMLTLISSVSAQRIAVNKKARLQRVILGVLDISVPPEATAEEVAGLYARRVQERDVDGRAFYLGLDKQDKVTGVAFEVDGPGFWGPIHGMMAVTPDAGEVLGLAFYQHDETPGLGARITEPWFRDQFKGKALAIHEKGRYFDLVAPGTADRPYEVDAVTGATETSRRVQKFLNQDLKDRLDLVKKAVSAG